MARIWIIPAGAGVLSALLFLAVAVGSPGALILGYLALWIGVVAARAFL